MKIRRMFERVSTDAELDPQVWAERMDSLMAADPRELLAFVGDAIIAMTAIADPAGPVGRDGIPAMLEIVRKSVEIEGVGYILEQTKERWAQILAVLGEHAPEAEVRVRLNDLARRAPWCSTCNDSHQVPATPGQPGDGPMRCLDCSPEKT